MREYLPTIYYMIGLIWGALFVNFDWYLGNWEFWLGSIIAVMGIEILAAVYE